MNDAVTRPEIITRYRDRLSGITDISTLENKTVVLVGLGSVGSDLGAKLVRLGVRVVGCDPDVLAVENLIRWALPVSIAQEVGKLKCQVWQDILQKSVPNARVEGHSLDIVQHATAFERLVVSEKPDLLVAATDTRDSRRTVNAMAACHKVPALFVGLSDGASSVRVEVVENAQRGPCHLCAVHAENIAPRSSDKRSRTPYGTDVDPEARGVSALPVDIAMGTAIATRVALLMLAGGDWRQYLRNGEQRGNVLFFSLRPDHWIFEDAYDRLVYQVQRVVDCPGCGEREDLRDG